MTPDCVATLYVRNTISYRLNPPSKMPAKIERGGCGVQETCKLPHCKHLGQPGINGRAHYLNQHIILVLWLRLTGLDHSGLAFNEFYSLHGSHL